MHTQPTSLGAAASSPAAQSSRCSGCSLHWQSCGRPFCATLLLAPPSLTRQAKVAELALNTSIAATRFPCKGTWFAVAGLMTLGASCRELFAAKLWNPKETGQTQDGQAWFAGPLRWWRWKQRLCWILHWWRWQCRRCLWWRRCNAVAGHWDPHVTTSFGCWLGRLRNWRLRPQRVHALRRTCGSGHSEGWWSGGGPCSRAFGDKCKECVL